MANERDPATAARTGREQAWMGMTRQPEVWGRDEPRRVGHAVHAGALECVSPSPPAGAAQFGEVRTAVLGEEKSAAHAPADMLDVYAWALSASRGSSMVERLTVDQETRVQFSSPVLGSSAHFPLWALENRERSGI